MSEPSTEFDYSAADDPAGEVMDELGWPTRGQARQILAWAATQGVGPASPILERVGLWIVGGYQDGDRAVALRARMFASTFAPTGRHSLSIRGLAKAHGRNKSYIGRLKLEMEASLFARITEPEVETGPDVVMSSKELEGIRKRMIKRK